MENKVFCDQFLKDSSELPDSDGKKPIAPALDPNCGAEEKPTTPAPPEKQKLDIDAILADIHNQAVARAHAAADTPSNDTLAAPPPNAPPGSTPDDDQSALREMTAAMRELTEELRYFRTQMEAHPESAMQASRQPMENLDGADSAEPPDDSTREYFSGVVLDGYGGSDTEAKPNIRGAPETETSTEAVEEKKKSSKILNVISNVLFYVVIVAIVLGAFLMRSTGKGQPFLFGGYSAANILTSSMENVYPKGSMIVTKQVDAKELVIGDDITFMVSEDTTVTHRIIGITENYQNTGQRAFETKGTMNPSPDKEMVVASNVVGKVVFHSKVLGNTANFVKANWPIMIFALLVIVGLISFLKWNVKRSEDKEEQKIKKEKPASHATK